MLKIVLASLLLGCIIWGIEVVIASEETPENILLIGNASHPCESNYSKASGEFSQNGTLGPNQECVLHFTPHYNETEIPGIYIFFKHLYLAEDDNVTIYEYGKNDSLYPPFHGQNDGVVVSTGKANLTIILKTSSRNDFVRKFLGYYQSQSCSIPIPDEVPSVLSPVYSQNSGDVECEYNYYKPKNYSHTFVFSDFNLSSDSSIEVKNSEHQDGSYKNIPPDIFSQKMITFKIKLKTNTPDQKFRITRRDIHQDCSGYIELKGGDPSYVFKSPLALKVRNTSAPTECCWLVHDPDGQGTIGLTLVKLEFESVFDLLAVNDGPSQLSQPLLQVTTSSKNDSEQIIRTSGKFMWISFRPLNFDSNFSANATVHGQGGYYYGNGTITMNPTSGQDTVFLVEVDESKRVLLQFSLSDFKPPATLSIYEDFGVKTKPTIQVHGNVWYPLISQTSRMMIIGTNFSKGTFAAQFSGITSDCMHMSRSESDTYILSGNCNNTCIWIIAPKENSEEELLLNLQYLSLDINDKVVISNLNNNIIIATITSKISQVPELSLKASDGGVISVERGNCTQKPNDVILIAHSNYLPGCSRNIQLKSSQEIQIKSPGYPNTYPLLAECMWNVTLSSKTNFLHLSFNNLQLAPNHYVRIISLKDKSPINNTYMGDQLPDDLLLNEDAVIQFDSTYNGTKTGVALISGEGFVINATVAACGGILNSTTGHFNTTNYPEPFINSSLCIWKVQVPSGEPNVSANIIVFSIENSKTENYELEVYDGASIRDKTVNLTGSEIWSRTNILYFVYKRLNTSFPSTALSINYHMLSCNKSSLCDNGICLHPNWRCDGKNDCGDFTDEKDCGSIPVPTPTPKPLQPNPGYSPLTLGLVIPFCLILGALIMVVVPRLISRYRGGNYHQFRDISGAE